MVVGAPPRILSISKLDAKSVLNEARSEARLDWHKMSTFLPASFYNALIYPPRLVRTEYSYLNHYYIRG